MADDDPILTALELKELGTAGHWSFQVSDIVSTAAMLAGGTDPIYKLRIRLQVHEGIIGKRQGHDGMTNIGKITTRIAERSFSTTPNDC
jgi:hypothetical protein